MMLVEALSSREYRTKRELAQILRITPREVEQLVERARKSGALPVMSGPDGYRLATSPEEYELNVAHRRKRALVQLITVRGELDYLRKWRAARSPEKAEPQPAQVALWR